MRTEPLSASTVTPGAISTKSASGSASSLAMTMMSPPSVVTPAAGAEVEVWSAEIVIGEEAEITMSPPAICPTAVGSAKAETVSPPSAQSSTSSAWSLSTWVEPWTERVCSRSMRARIGAPAAPMSCAATR